MTDSILEMPGLEPQLTPDAEILPLASALLAQGHESRQRRTLVIAGESGWCRGMASAVAGLPELNRVVWVSSVELAGREVVNASTAKSLLGQERDAVVFDAHSGFDPDAFGAVCGTICAGGLLVLVCPPLEEWEHVADPASERIAVSPYRYENISGRFIRRLVGIVRQAEGAAIVEQGALMPSLEPGSGTPVCDESPFDEPLDKLFRTIDQQTAVEAIEHVVHGHRRRPAVLVSDRGRGKSAALGMAAARLLINLDSQTDGSKRSMRIVVTAPRRSAVDALFFHARHLLPEAEIIDSSLQFKGSQIQYIAPDILCVSQESADLVLVDEAAAIPTSILTKLLKKYSRLVFATTVHGYEGTGRGFAVRFRQTLDEQTPGWNELRLQAPIRWAENDPLEQLVFRALLLDAESVADEKVLGVNVDNVTVECLDRKTLANDEETLTQIFGLLVVAHYRTTPNDLRNLLDGPDVSVYVMRSPSPSFHKEKEKGKGHVVATALVSAEGAFSDELADAIFAGQRRPRGHLIPQSLVTHAGIKKAAQLRCARIMRIAVHPVLQRKSLGGKLVQAIRHEVKAQGFHLMGVSFGATAELMHFWKTQAMHPVRVGFRRDHASGEHSVMMLAALNNQGDEVYQLARSRMLADFPHWLSDSLCELDTGVTVECLRNEGVNDDTEKLFSLSKLDEQTVMAFVNGARSYEDCSAALWRLTVASLMNIESHLQNIEQILLVARVLQKRTWAEVASLCDLSGRTEVIKGLRDAVFSLLDVGKKR